MVGDADGREVQENPLRSVPSSSFASGAVPSDLEGALAGLRDGNVSEGEMRAAMQHSATATHELINSFYAAEIRSLKEQVAAIAGPNTGALAGNTGTLEGFVKKVSAFLTETPQNWHQLVVYSAATRGRQVAGDDPELAAIQKRATHRLAISFVMVILQVVVTQAVIRGLWNPTCATSDTCQPGYFCAAFSFQGSIQASGASSCSPCASGPLGSGDSHAGAVEINRTRVMEVCAEPKPTPLPDLHRCWMGNERHDGQACIADVQFVTSWCDACVRAGWHADPTTHNSARAANYGSMSKGDHATVALAAVIIALVVVQELKDIILVTIALRHAGDTVEPGHRRAIQIMNGIRRWCFLPALVCSIPTVVVLKASDALSVCFNTVAILFLTDVRNLTAASINDEPTGAPNLG